MGSSHVDPCVMNLFWDFQNKGEKKLNSLFSNYKIEILPFKEGSVCCDFVAKVDWRSLLDYTKSLSAAGN